MLRTNLIGNLSFAELLKRVREVALGAYAHQNLPFELLVEKLQPQRDLSHTPLFQVMFVLENAPISALELPGLSLNFLESHSDSAKFDLTLYMAETESGIVGSLEYNTDLFEENTIQRMAAHLQTLFAGIVANPQQRLSELPLLTASEQHQLLVDWNDTQVEYSQYQSIHELFETQVEKTPDAIAVVFENQQLTYRELNIKANQLADYLRSLGVKPEVLVGICVERNLLRRSFANAINGNWIISYSQSRWCICTFRSKLSSTTFGFHVRRFSNPNFIIAATFSRKSSPS